MLLPAIGLVPLAPGTDVYVVLETEDSTIIEGPLNGIAVAVSNPLSDTGDPNEESWVLTLDAHSPWPNAQLMWFRLGVDAAFSRKAALELARNGPAIIPQ